MNNLVKISFLLGMLFSILACNQDIDKFDNGENYIYFNMPFKTDAYGRNTTVREDSLVHSFALDDISIASYTFKIPVNTVGLKNSENRNYEVEIVTDNTTASDSQWDKSTLSNPIIKSGNLQDTLYITVYRTPDLRATWKNITFRLLANDNFKLGDRNLLTAKISFTDILLPPTWWSKWQGVFGEFCREKFVKWQEIYYEGADPNLETIGGPGLGKPLYWNNMPNSTVSSWYPSTYMFIRILKQYFIDNVVYPDGDTTKPRVSLP